MSAQIYDDIDIEVNFHGLLLGKEDLMPGVLISGSSGTGKTITAVNELAAQIASQHAREIERKPALVYFVAKGMPQHDFIKRLPAERLGDVISVDLGASASHHLSLISKPYWPDHKSAAEAAVQLVIEHQRHMANGPDTDGGHKAFWDAQRNGIMSTLAGLVSTTSGGDNATRLLDDPSALMSLAARGSAFVKYLQKHKQDKKSTRHRP